MDAITKNRIEAFLCQLHVETWIILIRYRCFNLTSLQPNIVRNIFLLSFLIILLYYVIFFLWIIVFFFAVYVFSLLSLSQVKRFLDFYSKELVWKLGRCNFIIFFLFLIFFFFFSFFRSENKHSLELKNCFWPTSSVCTVFSVFQAARKLGKLGERIITRFENPLPWLPDAKTQFVWILVKLSIGETQNFFCPFCWVEILLHGNFHSVRYLNYLNFLYFT